MATTPIPDLILLGGGHAHVHVLESLATTDWPSVRPVLISPSASQIYSGMVPGFLQGQYSEAEISIDLAGLCRAAGAEFVEGAAERVDSNACVVHTTRGDFEFKLLSLDVGSAPAGLELPGVRENAIPLGTPSNIVGLRARVDELTVERAPRGTPARIAVVGAGAGGVEVALALDRRVRQGGGLPSVLLVDRGSQILSGYSDAARRKTTGILRKRAVTLLLDHEVIGASPGRIQLAGGGKIDADLIVWVGGAAPPALLADSTLPRSDDGYLNVDRTLRAVDGSPVWGAGDCIDLSGHDLPKAGVFAVRQGPVLAHNLRAAVTGAEPELYHPQSSYLSILNTADGKALLRWRPVVMHSRLSWRLKDRIDRRFVSRYAELTNS